jgi:hypothetical protein
MVRRLPDVSGVNGEDVPAGEIYEDELQRRETMAEGARFEASAGTETIRVGLSPSPIYQGLIAEAQEEEYPIKTDGER